MNCFSIKLFTVTMGAYGRTVYSAPSFVRPDPCNGLSSPWLFIIADTEKKGPEREEKI